MTTSQFHPFALSPPTVLQPFTLSQIDYLSPMPIMLQKRRTSNSENIPLQAALKLRRRGRINYTLFWKNLAPVKEGGGKLKDAKLEHAIERDFGTFERFKMRPHPITGVNIWEHAFHLQVFSFTQYLSMIWNVINFRRPRLVSWGLIESPKDSDERNQAMGEFSSITHSTVQRADPAREPSPCSQIRPTALIPPH
ncbi:hypothetical protein EI94DRAFT_1703005 [Lactarius quietus]|nr:hypothetical protein EI94DRAFT_1703005 [Lactarius quietus]